MKRTLFPILLAVLGTTLLVGCFYWPVPSHLIGTGEVDKIFEGVGDSNSRRPLRVGEVTRAQVLLIAPQPERASEDGKSLLYITYAIKGYMILPLCFKAEPEEEGLEMRLNFGDDGVLRSYQIHHGGENMQEINAGMIWPIDFESRTKRYPWPPPLPTTRPSQSP